MFGAAILEAISLSGKFGGVFSVLAEVARVASVPFRLFGGLVMGGIGMAVRAVVAFLRVDPLSQHGRMPSVAGGVIEVQAQDIYLAEIDRDRVTSCAIVSDRNRR